jgi:two-component system NtrC family sensor kinase
MNPQSASPVAHSPRTPRGAAPLAARIASLEHALAQKQQALDDLQAEMKRTTDFIREVDRVLPGALLGVDARGFVFSANDAAVRLLGHDRDELLGKAFAEIQVEPAFTGEALTALLGERRVVSHERTWLDRLGHRIPVQLSLAASGGPDEAPPMYICVAADLRERRRMELEIRQKQKLEAVGQLAAGVAHEINTPVQYVGDSLHFLRESFEALSLVAHACRDTREGLASGAVSAPDFARQLDELFAEADLEFVMENAPPAFVRAVDGIARVAEIVGAMLECAHPAQKSRAATDLNRTIHNVLTVARSEYKYVADVALDLRPLPPVICHAGDIGQVLLNLIVNAGHAMADVFRAEQVRGVLTVRSSVDSEADAVVVEIGDSGGGIPADVHERIFEPFFTTKPVGRGTGQGLAIARAIAERHGGSLRFETTLGVGTTFMLRLPTGATTRTR